MRRVEFGRRTVNVLPLWLTSEGILSHDNYRSLGGKLRCPLLFICISRRANPLEQDFQNSDKDSLLAM